jgi:hypothetical protein
MAKSKRRKATRKATRKAAPKRRKVSRRVAIAKAAPKRRKVYRIGAVKRSKPRKMSKPSIMSAAKEGAMTGAGMVAGAYLGQMAAKFITNPYLRAGAVFAGGVLLGRMAPGLRPLAAGLSGTGVLMAGAQLLPGLPSPASPTVTGIGALTAAEKRMIERAAMGEGVGAAPTPQSEVLTGLYDTDNVLA